MSLIDEPTVVDMLSVEPIDESLDLLRDSLIEDDRLGGALDVDGLDASESSDESLEDVLFELLEETTCEPLVDESLVDDPLADESLVDDSLVVESLADETLADDCELADESLDGMWLLD